jgi:signal peptidase I
MASRRSLLHIAVLVLVLGGCNPSANTPTQPPGPSLNGGLNLGRDATAAAATDPCAGADGTLFLTEAVGMEPTLEPGDKLIIGPTKAAVGDMVVFDPPSGYQASPQDIQWIKRVMGVGGDTVELKNGAVWVNGQKLNEPYVYEGQTTDALTGQTLWNVPYGYVFVLGDHRQASQDSRTLGPIAIGSVIGQVTYRCFPAAGRGPIS